MCSFSCISHHFIFWFAKSFWLHILKCKRCKPISNAHTHTHARTRLYTLLCSATRRSNWCMWNSHLRLHQWINMFHRLLFSPTHFRSLTGSFVCFLCLSASPYIIHAYHIYYGTLEHFNRFSTWNKNTHITPKSPSGKINLFDWKFMWSIFWLEKCNSDGHLSHIACWDNDLSNHPPFFLHLIRIQIKQWASLWVVKKPSGKRCFGLISSREWNDFHCSNGLREGNPTKSVCVCVHAMFLFSVNFRWNIEHFYPCRIY